MPAQPIAMPIITVAFVAVLCANASCQRAVSHEQSRHLSQDSVSTNLPSTFLVDHPLGDPATFVSMSTEEKVAMAYGHVMSHNKPITVDQLNAFFGHRGVRLRPQIVDWFLDDDTVFFAAYLKSDTSSDSEPVAGAYWGHPYR